MRPLVWIGQVGDALRGLEDEYVLVGACAAATYDLGPLDIRETHDVDLVVRASSMTEWQHQLRRFEQRGLRPDPTAHLARHRLGELAVDLMPTPWDRLGHNRWYPDAFEVRERHPETGVPVITPDWFLATKLEAWRDRGRNDPRVSTDLEDIVTLLRGHAAIWQRISGQRRVDRFIRSELRAIGGLPDALEVVQGHVDQDEASQAAVAALLQRMIDLGP